MKSRPARGRHFAFMRSNAAPSALTYLCIDRPRAHARGYLVTVLGTPCPGAFVRARCARYVIAVNGFEMRKLLSRRIHPPLRLAYGTLPYGRVSAIMGDSYD